MEEHLLTENETFQFACHSKVACFTHCCKNADMFLYPYDIVRLKNHLNMSSEAFLAEYTITAFRENPYFPNVMLKMTDKPGNPCHFLMDSGCSVYEDRPYSCRAYPLEPVMYGDENNEVSIRCYVVKHDHCLGHFEDRKWTANQWMADQGMDEYNKINAEWAQLYALFQQKPFGETPENHPALKMAYMASYNIDTFRRFVFESSFLSKFQVPQNRIDAIQTSDTELLLFGFDWIKRFLGNQGPLK